MNRTLLFLLNFVYFWQIAWLYKFLEMLDEERTKMITQKFLEMIQAQETQ